MKVSFRAVLAVMLAGVLLVVWLSGVAAGAGPYGPWPDEREPGTLLYNGSFETVKYEPAFSGEALVAVAGGEYEVRPLYWQWRTPLVVDESVSHSGDVSVRIDGPSSGSVRQAVGYYVYERGSATWLLPGRRYELSGWFKSEGVEGAGVRVRLAGEPNAPLEWVTGSCDWQRVARAFVAPEVAVPGGHVWLEWAIENDGVAWVDDLQLRPVDGELAVTDGPTISPAGGTFQGRVAVTLSSDVPGAVIHYTVDGSEPTRHSVEYVGPFLVDGPTTVKAGVFHTAYETAVSEARFEIEPKRDVGVPFYPTGWGMDVEQWWAGHFYNPKSRNRIGNGIVSPEPRINVARVRASHPESDTGGIAEALAQLPESGGTLWFPKDQGPYPVTGRLRIQGRSHLHFLSDGAVIEILGRQIVFCSDDAWNWRSFILNPVSDFYFRNLHFRSDKQHEQGFYFRHCVDVLFDDCLFTDFGSGQRRNIISANVNTDNIWYRGCEFRDNSSGFPTYWDGVHNAGCVGCWFSGDYGGGDFLIYTNNDMSPFCAYQRTGQYVVFQDCSFRGEPGRRGRNALGITTANVLLRGNDVKGPFDSFVFWQGRGMSNTQPGLRFSGAGLKLVDNHVEGVEQLVQFCGDVAQRHRQDQFRMANEIRGNDVIGATYAFNWNPVNDPHFPPYACLEDVVFEDNVFTGGTVSQVKLFADSENEIERITVNDHEIDVRVEDPHSIDRIKAVRFINNRVHLTDPSWVVDRHGEPMAHDGFEIRGNEIVVE